MWVFELPLVPELAWVSAVKPDPTALNSPPFPSRPKPPMTSSWNCVIAPDVVALRLVAVPVAVPD